MTDQESMIKVDETADIHPSVILEGNITIGRWTKIEAGTVIVGNVTIGHHTWIACNVVIRGTNRIGNYVHIYDQVCIEGGRGTLVLPDEESDESIIGDGAWINHGATMHGSQVGENAVLDLNAALDYGCKIGSGSIVTNGSACRSRTVVPENCIVEGVPAKIVKRDITDVDRRYLMGLVPCEFVALRGRQLEEKIKAKRGLQ